MRKPSSRCLVNRVTLYRFTPSQDEDAGVQVTPYGAAFATDVSCSVQPALPARFFDAGTGRLTEKTMYHVLFAQDYSLATDDKVVWIDDASVHHNLYVHGNADQAGRGAAFVVSCEERT